MCLTKIPVHGIFKLLSVIYFQNMCIVTCNLSRKNSALLCFLDSFGIAVQGPELQCLLKIKQDFS